MCVSENELVAEWLRESCRAVTACEADNGSCVQVIMMITVDSASRKNGNGSHSSGKLLKICHPQKLVNFMLDLEFLVL